MESVESVNSSNRFTTNFIFPLIAGGVAGSTVDLVLFPLDTIKTRLQSKRGFIASGGFRSVYAGILPAMAGSAPSAATFFCTYELVKYVVGGSSMFSKHSSVVHMLAASLGEATSCVVRVPFEVTKQRAQANRDLRPLQILRHTLQTEGPLGLYRGYLTTVMREIPFSFIQYPLWERLKFYGEGIKAALRFKLFLGKMFGGRKKALTWSLSQGAPVQPWQGAVCGAVAGGIAAAITTPLDVAKTRRMLAKSGSEETELSIVRLLISIGKTEGVRGLFAGFVPRVCWISVGGFVFLGAYEKTKQLLRLWIGV